MIAINCLYRFVVLSTSQNIQNFKENYGKELISKWENLITSKILIPVPFLLFLKYFLSIQFPPKHTQISDPYIFIHPISWFFTDLKFVADFFSIRFQFLLSFFFCCNQDPFTCLPGFCQDVSPILLHVASPILCGTGIFRFYSSFQLS